MHAGQRGAGAKLRCIGVQAAKRLVGHQHAATRVEHDHAFGQCIESTLHPVRDHRGRVEMLQRAPHVQAKHQDARACDEEHREHQGLGQPAPQRAPFAGAKGHLERTPTCAAGIQWHAHLVGLRTLVGARMPCTLVIAGLHHQHPVGPAHRQRTNAFGARCHVVQRLLQGLAIVVLQQCGHLHGKCFTDALAQPHRLLTRVWQHTEEQVGHQHQHAGERDQRHRHLNQGTCLFHQSSRNGRGVAPLRSNRPATAISAAISSA